MNNENTETRREVASGPNNSERKRKKEEGVVEGGKYSLTEQLESSLGWALGANATKSPRDETKKPFSNFPYQCIKRFWPGDRITPGLFRLFFPHNGGLPAGCTREY